MNDKVISIEDLRLRLVAPKQQDTVPPHLPSILQSVYEDAEFNFRSRRWKPAVQLYLQSLEFACVLLETNGNENEANTVSAQKTDLTKRINGLFESGSIALSLKEWAHQIRVIGQYHKHRYVDATEADCLDIRSFAEMFLRSTFSTPAQIELRRANLKESQSTQRNN